MRNIFTSLAIVCCVAGAAQVNTPEESSATLADTILQDDATYDIIVGCAFPGSVEKWYAGPYALSTLSLRFNYSHVSVNAGAGISNTIAANTKLHLSGGISARTGKHLFEAGAVRYGLGNASRPWLDGSEENGWMYRVLYGYRTGMLYPFVEGGLVFANTHEERMEQPLGGDPTLVYSATANSQSWWVVAGGVFDHELSNHILTNLKLGIGIDNSEQRKEIRAINEPDQTIDSSRNPGFIVVCGFGVGYRFH